LLIGPLATDIGRKRGDGDDKQNRRYKKQLFGHSVEEGVPGASDVTGLAAGGPLSYNRQGGRLPPSNLVIGRSSLSFQ
jgi:hypothetical protein